MPEVALSVLPMNSQKLLSLSAVVSSLIWLLTPSPLFANPRLNGTLRQTQTPSPNTSVAQTPAEGDRWENFPQIQTGFMQGCLGSEELAEAQAETKRNYCECAFDAYSGRFSPQQFRQIDALATRIGEDGPLLVSVMMAPELGSCSEKTGYQFQ